MDNTEGIVLIIGMLIVFIGIPTFCICSRKNNYEIDNHNNTNNNTNNNTYTQLKTNVSSTHGEA